MRAPATIVFSGVVAISLIIGIWLLHTKGPTRSAGSALASNVLMTGANLVAMGIERIPVIATGLGRICNTTRLCLVVLFLTERLCLGSPGAMLDSMRASCKY